MATQGLLNPRDTRVRLAQDFKTTVTGYPWVVVEFSLWWLWIILVYQSSIVFPTVEIAGRDIDTCLGPIFAIAVTLVVMAVVYKRRRFVLRGRKYLVGVAVFMTVGAVGIVAWRCFEFSFASPVGGAAYAVASAVLGVSSAFMYTENNRLLGWLGMHRTIYLSIVSMFISSLVVIVLSLLSPYVTYAFLLAMPALMLACLLRTIREFPQTSYFEHGKDAELYFPVKFVSTSAVEGISLGIMASGLMAGGGLMMSEGVAFGAHVIAIGLLVASAFLFRMDLNRLVYQISFPVMALGFLVVGCFPLVATWGGAVQLVGYGFLDLVLWALGSYLIKDAGLPATWITAVPSGALFSGVVVGNLAGTYLVQDLPLTGGFADGDLRVVACICAFVILLAALVLSNNKNLEYGWGTIRPADKQAPVDALANCCLYLANEHALTTRESDTLLLLAQGLERKAISEKLFVSENTVKTHVRNVYRKLGVGSRKELRDLVSETQTFLEGE